MVISAKCSLLAFMLALWAVWVSSAKARGDGLQNRAEVCASAESPQLDPLMWTSKTPKALLFSHAPKTGGSTMEALLSAASRHSSVPLITNLASSGRRPTDGCLHGNTKHTKYSCLSPHLQEPDIARVILLRHPFDMIVSLYRYVVGLKSHFRHETFVKYGSFDNMVESTDMSFEILVEFLEAPGRNPFDVLLNEYVGFGFLEHMDATKKLWACQFPWLNQNSIWSKQVWANRAQSPKLDQLSFRAARILATKIANSAVLYEAALAVFLKRLALCNITLTT